MKRPAQLSLRPAFFNEMNRICRVRLYNSSGFYDLLKGYFTFLSLTGFTTAEGMLILDC